MPVQLLQRGLIIFVICKIVINCIILVFEPGICQCSCFREDKSALVSTFCCVSARYFCLASLLVFDNRFKIWGGVDNCVLWFERASLLNKNITVEVRIGRFRYEADRLALATWRSQHCICLRNRRPGFESRQGIWFNRKS
jgi:hypothetical protein